MNLVVVGKGHHDAPQGKDTGVKRNTGLKQSTASVLNNQQTLVVATDSRDLGLR